MPQAKYQHPRLICRCGKSKPPRAAQCRDCYEASFIRDVEPVLTNFADPVRGAFELIIRQSRGTIS